MHQHGKKTGLWSLYQNMRELSKDMDTDTCMYVHMYQDGKLVSAI